MKKSLRTVVLISSLLAVMVVSAVAQSAPMAQKDSLYKRVGGFDAIAAVTDDFIQRMASDQQLKRFFTGFNSNSLERIREHIVDFLCQAMGGPCKYHGLDMKAAHTGLKISEQDWQAAVTDLTATLDRFKVPKQEHDELMSAIAGLKGDIVGR